MAPAGQECTTQVQKDKGHLSMDPRRLQRTAAMALKQVSLQQSTKSKCFPHSGPFIGTFKYSNICGYIKQL